MAFSNRRGEKQVRLTVFNNEPMARLAEQRLTQMGIPCFIRSLRGGPGLWGSAYNLPHGLYVHESDEAQAGEVLDLVPRELSQALAQELSEEGDRPAPPLSNSSLWLVLAGAVLAILFLLVTVAVFSGPLG